jgi:hypothetical protein
VADVDPTSYSSVFPGVHPGFLSFNIDFPSSEMGEVNAAKLANHTMKQLGEDIK